MRAGGHAWTGGAAPQAGRGLLLADRPQESGTVDLRQGASEPLHSAKAAGTAARALPSLNPPVLSPLPVVSPSPLSFSRGLGAGEPGFDSGSATRA